ncbi:DDE_4 domain-containing protein, partial [Cephalotus follicularis]
DCIGAIDGVHVPVCISPLEAIPYIGRKGIPTQNVMAACKYYLVDSGYLPRKGYISPYKRERYYLPDFQLGRSPVSAEEIFNYTHSSLRSVIERAFGEWKKKWKIIKTMHSYPLDRQFKIVAATMTIHNFIRKNTIQDRHFAEFDDNATFVLEDELEDLQNEPEWSQTISQRERR